MIYYKAVFGEPFRAPEPEGHDPTGLAWYMNVVGQAFSEWVNIQYEGLGY